MLMPQGSRNKFLDPSTIWGSTEVISLAMSLEYDLATDLVNVPCVLTVYRVARYQQEMANTETRSWGRGINSPEAVTYHFLGHQAGSYIST